MSTVVREIFSTNVVRVVSGNWHHKLVKFVVGSCLAPMVFLGVLRFSSLHKNHITGLNFDVETVDKVALHGICHGEFLCTCTY